MPLGAPLRKRRKGKKVKLPMRLKEKFREQKTVQCPESDCGRFAVSRAKEREREIEEREREKEKRD